MCRCNAGTGTDGVQVIAPTALWRVMERPSVHRNLLTVSWLRSTFAHPRRVELPCGHHLRPIRADDVDIDYPAVMGSRERLWSIYGEPWGWPPATMTIDKTAPTSRGTKLRLRRRCPSTTPS